MKLRNFFERELDSDPAMWANYEAEWQKCQELYYAPDNGAEPQHRSTAGEDVPQEFAAHRGDRTELGSARRAAGRAIPAPKTIKMKKVNMSNEQRNEPLATAEVRTATTEVPEQTTDASCNFLVSTPEPFRDLPEFGLVRSDCFLPSDGSPAAPLILMHWHYPRFMVKCNEDPETGGLTWEGMIYWIDHPGNHPFRAAFLLQKASNLLQAHAKRAAAKGSPVGGDFWIGENLPRLLNLMDAKTFVKMAHTAPYPSQVRGLLFRKNCSEIALVKTAGRSSLDAIDGLVKNGESPLWATKRIFAQKAGLRITDCLVSEHGPRERHFGTVAVMVVHADDAPLSAGIRWYRVEDVLMKSLRCSRELVTQIKRAVDLFQLEVNRKRHRVTMPRPPKVPSKPSSRSSGLRRSLSRLTTT